MSKKNRIIIILLICLIAVASISSIFLYNKEHDVEQNAKKVDKKNMVSIENFKSKLIDAQLNITVETDNTECEKIGTVEGKKYVINDKTFQVYRFDLESDNELAVSNRKMAEEEGKILMPSFNNLELKVEYNKGLILLDIEDHPDKDKIIEVFKTL